MEGLPRLEITSGYALAILSSHLDRLTTETGSPFGNCCSGEFFTEQMPFLLPIKTSGACAVYCVFHIRPMLQTRK